MSVHMCTSNVLRLASASSVPALGSTPITTSRVTLSSTSTVIACALWYARAGPRHATHRTKMWLQSKGEADRTQPRPGQGCVARWRRRWGTTITHTAARARAPRTDVRGVAHFGRRPLEVLPRHGRQVKQTCLQTQQQRRVNNHAPWVRAGGGDGARVFMESPEINFPRAQRGCVPCGGARPGCHVRRREESTPFHYSHQWMRTRRACRCCRTAPAWT